MWYSWAGHGLQQYTNQKVDSNLWNQRSKQDISRLLWRSWKGFIQCRFPDKEHIRMKNTTVLNEPYWWWKHMSVSRHIQLKHNSSLHRACSAVVTVLRFGIQGPGFEPGLFHNSMLHASSWLLNEAKNLIQVFMLLAKLGKAVTCGCWWARAIACRQIGS